MGTKTPAVAYYERKMQTTSRSDLLDEWSDAPITETDISFLCDLLEKKTARELAEKYNYSEGGLAKYKRRLLTQLHRYDMAQITR